MARVELVMPKMGESIIEATILKWTKNIGDMIEQDEPVLEIATDKVDSEVPSPVAGKLMETLFKEGDVVPVGKVIAIIETEAVGGGDAPSGNGHGKVEVKQVEQPVLAGANVGANVQTATPPVLVHNKPNSGRFYSPLVLNIARTEGVSMEELENIPGTGNGGRVTKKDIFAYLQGPRTQVATQTATVVKEAEPVKVVETPAAKQTEQKSSGGITIAQKSFVHSGEYDIVEMDRMRKMIAENMVYSKHTSAHVTSFVEADVTNIVLWREKVKDEFQKKYGEKLTFTPMFIEAVAKALREMPMINISVDGDRLLVKKDINIGIAVALPTDNLIVPVIRHADRMNLVGLTAAVNDLAKRARNNKLKLDELEGGTYTLSNVGTFGNVMGTPIIMQPQVAILATGAIRKKPAVIETEQGDYIGIRHQMFLSHSYDHRVVDGALGGRFVRRVADLLEKWDINREI